jgi:hypothetical protein
MSCDREAVNINYAKCHQSKCCGSSEQEAELVSEFCTMEERLF